MGGGKGSSGGGGGYVGRRYDQMPELSGGSTQQAQTAPRAEGGGNISSPPTGPSAAGGGMTGRASTSGYTDKMTSAMMSRAAKYGTYGATLGPMAMLAAAVAGAYHEKSILDGEMSHRGRSLPGEPVIGNPSQRYQSITARQGGYKSLLDDDDDGSGGTDGTAGGYTESDAASARGGRL